MDSIGETNGDATESGWERMGTSWMVSRTKDPFCRRQRLFIQDEANHDPITTRSVMLTPSAVDETAVKCPKSCTTW